MPKGEAMKKKDDERSHIINAWPTGMVVDGKKNTPDNCMGKGGASFANHSAKPNAETKTIHYFDGVLFDVFIVAIKNIPANKEILLNYGNDYWKNSSVTLKH